MDTGESGTEQQTPRRPRPSTPRGAAGAAGRWTPARCASPAYRRLWSSTIVTAVGSQLTAVAVPKQIYDITGSSAWVSTASTWRDCCR
ncbi:hypothetical protein SGLAM104S_00600 [Streptomyces glaucescens]